MGLALRGVCFGPGLVSDCFLLGSDLFLVRSRFRLVLGGASAPKNKSEPVSNHKTNNLKPNPVQNRHPAKPTHALACPQEQRPIAVRAQRATSRPWRAHPPSWLHAGLVNKFYYFLRIGDRPFVGSGWPRGPWRPFRKVGGEAPHLLQGSPGPPVPPRPPK